METGNTMPKILLTIGENTHTVGESETELLTDYTRVLFNIHTALQRHGVGMNHSITGRKYKSSDTQGVVTSVHNDRFIVKTERGEKSIPMTPARATQLLDTRRK